MTDILDARGVPIAPGDTVIYGFGVGRSVALAEGVVLADTTHVDGADTDACPGCPDGPHLKVSLTPSGRVRVRVVRRSYGGGEKPVVDVAPDRLVVLKPPRGLESVLEPYLPPSPLPTQADKVRVEMERRIALYTEDLRSSEITWGRNSFADLAEFHAYAARQMAKLRKQLRELDD